jgi:glycosyltransferase involved in cell wall biosynthesis
MHILHILPSMALETGGTMKAVMQLCGEQSRNGHSVVLYTSHWPRETGTASPNPAPFSTGTFVIKAFPIKRSRLMSNLPYSPELIRSLRSVSRKFDLVITHSLWNPLATFSMRALRENGIPYGLMPHGMLDPVVFRRNRWKKLPWAFLWERSNVEKAAIVLFNTAAEEEKAKCCGWRLPQTFILPHLIDLAEWKDLPPRSTLERFFPQIRGSEIILFVGRINWVKNLDKLIEALALVRQKRPSAMLVCVGPDNDGYKEELVQRVRSLGLSQYVLFTGMLESQQLKAAYACSDVLALVSQKENFGISVAEGLACGRPVVVSEGVDMANGWPSEGPIRRVRPKPDEIAWALIELLERSKRCGLPDLDARALAERQFQRSPLSEFLDRWQSLKTQRV